MTEVTPDVFCIGFTDVNAVVLREGDALALIDGGWPGDVATIEDAIRSIGNQPEDVRAILLTHAQIDHLGAVQSFHHRFKVPVYADPVEVGHAARDYLEQASEADVMKGPMPQTSDWWERVVKVGALDHPRPRARSTFPAGQWPSPPTATLRGTVPFTCRQRKPSLPAIGASTLGMLARPSKDHSRALGSSITPSPRPWRRSRCSSRLMPMS